jgi:undecaprenol kinase
MKRFVKGFAYAAKGIRAALEGQLNLKIHFGLAAAVIIAGLYVGLSSLEWCLILLAIGLVISLEMINTGIEKIVDLVTEEVHPLAAQAKDIAAGSVLVASIISAIVGWIVFKPYAIAWWQSW